MDSFVLCVITYAVGFVVADMLIHNARDQFRGGITNSEIVAVCAVWPAVIAVAAAFWLAETVDKRRSR